MGGGIMVEEEALGMVVIILGLGAAKTSNQ